MNKETLLEKIIREERSKNINRELDESSLSRIYQHLSNYDIAVMSAFRYLMINCANSGEKYDETKILTKDENLERNRQLQGSLLRLKYGVTKVLGITIENYGEPDAEEIKENSFFIVNLNNDNDFVDSIIKLGIYFCQNSVLIKEKSKIPYYYGTNKSNIPGFNKKINLGRYVPGKEAEFFSKINGRPFHFETIKEYGMLGRAALSVVADPIIEGINKININN